MAMLGAPKGLVEVLGPLPPGVTISRSLDSATFEVILFFSTEQADLEKRFAGLCERLDPNGGLWLAWPKRASGVAVLAHIAVRCRQRLGQLGFRVVRDQSTQLTAAHRIGLSIE